MKSCSGQKTITCDNVHAVLPFGAIDTPTQGGTASGTGFFNFGWALTPLPNSIPTNGSTITVWVDGAALGHPSYNNYRGDIATLFPGIRQLQRGGGCIHAQHDGYADGVHTIAWSVTDSAGNTDGIGSRYFSILNSVGRVRRARRLRASDGKTGSQGRSAESAQGNVARRRPEPGLCEEGDGRERAGRNGPPGCRRRDPDLDSRSHPGGDLPERSRRRRDGISDDRPRSADAE